MKTTLVVFLMNLIIATATQAQTMNKYAVVVGCADYQAEGMDLRYSDDDAYRYYAYLLSCKGGGAVDNENVACLIDEAATKSNILNTLDNIFANATENDMLIFYFSGHGTEGAFVPTDATNQFSSLITYDEVKTIFKKHPAKYKICIADACFAGKIFEGQPTATTTTTTENQTTNVVIMMSSEASETSQENPHIRQGTFSYYLLKGLRGAADRNDDNIITLKEIFPYIKANVLNFTNNWQTPVIEGAVDIDMPLGFLKLFFVTILHRNIGFFMKCCVLPFIKFLTS